MDENEEFFYQYWLNLLSEKKVGWEEFMQKMGDLLLVSRLSTAQGRTILHLAVLENRLDIIEKLKTDASLQLRRDAFGMSPIDLAQLLDRKEGLNLLRPCTEMQHIPEVAEWGSFAYLLHPIFESVEGLEKVLTQVAKSKKGDKIAAEKIWMGVYFDKEINQGIHPPVSVRYIDEEVGYGVFADKKISPCAFVGEYTGEIQERKPKELKEKKYALRYTVWEGKKNFAIDAEYKGNFTRFLNHSEKPNLVLQSVYWRGIPRMIFVALKEIGEGKQLTFDYGPLFWKEMDQIPKDFPDDY